MQSFRDFLILAVDQAIVPLNNSHLAAETAHGLRQLKPHIAASEDEEMFRNSIKFQCSDMGEGFRFSKAGSGIDSRPGSRVDDDPLCSKQAFAAFSKANVDGSGSNKASRAHDQFGTALFVQLKVHLDQACNHLALASAHRLHVNFPILLGNSEFLTSLEIGRDFGAMNNVLARKARNIRAGTSNVLPLKDNGLHPLFGHYPGDVLACFSAAEHKEIIFFRLRGWCFHKSITECGHSAQPLRIMSRAIITISCLEELKPAR